MKYLCLLLALTTGCAKPKPIAPAVPREAIPPKCILGGLVDKARCDQDPKNPSLAICQNVVIKYACIEVTN